MKREEHDERLLIELCTSLLDCSWWCDCFHVLLWNIPLLMHPKSQNHQKISADRSLRCCLPLSHSHLWNQTKHFLQWSFNAFISIETFLSWWNWQTGPVRAAQADQEPVEKEELFLSAVQWSATQQFLFQPLNDSCSRVNLLKKERNSFENDPFWEWNEDEKQTWESFSLLFQTTLKDYSSLAGKKRNEGMNSGCRLKFLFHFLLVKCKCRRARHETGVDDFHIHLHNNAIMIHIVIKQFDMIMNSWSPAVLEKVLKKKPTVTASSPLELFHFSEPNSSSGFYHIHLLSFTSLIIGLKTETLSSKKIVWVRKEEHFNIIWVIVYIRGLKHLQNHLGRFFTDQNLAGATKTDFIL